MRNEAYSLLLSAARAACDAETNRADAEAVHAQRALALAATQLRALTEASGTAAAGRVAWQRERLVLRGEIEAARALAADAAGELASTQRESAAVLRERAALVALQSEARKWEAETMESERSRASDDLVGGGAVRARIVRRGAAPDDSREAVLAATEHIARLRGELAVALEKVDENDSERSDFAAKLRSVHLLELKSTRAEHAAALEFTQRAHADALRGVEDALAECRRKRADELRRSIENVGAMQVQHAEALAAAEARGARRVDEADGTEGGAAQEGTASAKKKRRKRKKKKKNAGAASAEAPAGGEAAATKDGE